MQIPGDKSISHRALIKSAISDKNHEIIGLCEGSDCEMTINALRNLGVSITHQPGYTQVAGVGLHGLRAPKQALDCGNSGTCMRLLAGLLVAQPFDSCLVGDASLMRRPMARIVAPLRQMGAGIEMTSDGTAPLQISGNPDLTPIHYRLPIASAQVKSCLLLASLYTGNQSVIVDPFHTRDHTERMLTCDETVLHIPGDISSAAFFIVAASIAKNCELRLEQIGVNPTRMGIIDNLRLMGADIQLSNHRILCNEPVADITVRSAPLHALLLPVDNIVNCIDEFPILFIAAACATGTSHFAHLAELRVKESDRIKAMAQGLTRLGIEVVTQADAISITGGCFTAGEVDSFADHRVAMAFAIAQSVAKGAIRIRNCDNVATSFPNFRECLKQMEIDVCLQ